MSLIVNIGVGIGEKTRAKVKINGASPTCYVDPLHGTKPNIIFDKTIELSWRNFWEKYDIYNKGITSKRLKIGKYIEEEEVVILFGPCNRNGYRYCHYEDEALISKVETLWMIMHQRTQVPNIQMINKAEAYGITYEIKIGKKVNWCALAKLDHTQLAL